MAMEAERGATDQALEDGIEACGLGLGQRDRDLSRKTRCNNVVKGPHTKLPFEMALFGPESN